MLNKANRIKIIGCIICNLLCVALAGKAIWGYWHDWGLTGPAQRTLRMANEERKQRGLNEVDLLTSRRPLSERLLSNLHYGFLPVMSGSMLLSSAMLVWVLRKKDL